MKNHHLGRRAGAVAAVLAVTTGFAGTAGAATAGAATAAAPAVSTAEVAPLSVSADSVDYATWAKDTKEAVDKAAPYVEERAEKAHEEKQALVLDIDNTSLESHFHTFPPTPAVKPVLELVKYADSKGVDVFFVTARPGIYGPVTSYNLKKVGYPVDGVYERGFFDFFRDVAEYKTAQRVKIEANGYKIIANIGNNPHDLSGGHAESTVKLPDYDGELS